MKNNFRKVLKKRELLKSIIPSLLLISAYLLFIMESTKELPFVYNQF